MNLNNQEKDDFDIYPTVFTVPNNKPFVLKGKAAEEFLKELSNHKRTKKDRELIRQKADKWRKKPENKHDEQRN